MLFSFFFFFSSRRRHTRFDCDWSSDVCSSDLTKLGIIQVPGGKAVFPTLTVAEHLRAGGWLYRRSEEHTSELQSQSNLVCRLLLEKKKMKKTRHSPATRRRNSHACISQHPRDT